MSNAWTIIATTDTLNSTSASIRRDFFNPATPDDIALDALHVLAALLSLYLLISLSHYECTLGRDTGGDKQVRKRPKSRIGKGLRVLCILSAVFCLLRCINDIVYYKGQASSHIPCVILKNIGASWLSDVSATVYLFLWLRHRVLYQNRALKLQRNILITFASWLTLILIIALVIAQNAALIGWRTYEYDAGGAKCILVGKKAATINKYLFLAGSQTLHIALLLLFIYPLLRHAARMRQGPREPLRKSCSLNSDGSLQNKTVRDKKGLLRMVFKCMMLSFLCVATDTVALLASIYMVTASKARHLIYNVNVLTNTVAIIMSFVEWRDMLIPFRNCGCSRKKQPSEAHDHWIVRYTDGETEN